MIILTLFDFKRITFGNQGKTNRPKQLYVAVAQVPCNSLI